MPTYWTWPRSDGAKKPVEKYRLAYDLDGPEVAERLLAKRIYYARLKAEFDELQKQFLQDREWARFFKEEARDAQKHYRAACLLIPWVCSAAPGDCRLDDPYSFPPELYGPLDRVAIDCLIG